MRRPLTALLGLLCVATAARAATPWAQARAPLRFELNVTAPPSDPSAGILAIIPDGGLLPGPVPEAIVTGPDGTVLKSECVWLNRREGYGLVFEAVPMGAQVFVYVQPAAQAPRAPALFTAGLLLFTSVGDASLETASKMARAVPPGPNATLGRVDRIGQMANPFGSSENYSSYYTGWLKPAKAGRTYICTISDDGSECRIDGKVVASWPGEHTRDAGRKGQFGDWVDLTAGLHRIEYVHFRRQGQPEANVCWRTADDKNPLAQTIPAHAYVQSGTAQLRDAQFRDGRPAAVFTPYPTSYLWPRDKPLTLITFTADLASRHPAGTTYTWTFPGGMQAEGQTVPWIFDVPLPQDVSLTVNASNGVSKCTRPVAFGPTPPRASPNSPSDRKIYRDALLARCRAVPAARRPCADWTPDLWAALVAVVEPYKAKALLLEIFNRSRQDVLMQDDASRAVLEAAFFDVIRYTDRPAAKTWLDRLEQEDKSAARRYDWKLARIEFTLYDLNDAAAARQLAQQLRAQAEGPEQSVCALVRLGDVERMAGNYDEARKLYSTAQDRFAEIAESAPNVAAATNAPSTTGRLDPKRLVPVKDLMHPPPLRETPKAGSPKERGPDIDAWKSLAVREASFLTTTESQLRQGDIAEARKTLRKWEMELPLSKLNGDFPLAEAKFYMNVQDYERAWRILKVYRGGIEISSYLPEAMTMELECLRSLKREQEAKDLAREMIKRFPAHPAAERAKDYL